MSCFALISRVSNSEKSPQDQSSMNRVYFQLLLGVVWCFKNHGKNYSFGYYCHLSRVYLMPQSRVQDKRDLDGTVNNLPPTGLAPPSVFGFFLQPGRKKKASPNVDQVGSIKLAHNLSHVCQHPSMQRERKQKGRLWWLLSQFSDINMGLSHSSRKASFQGPVKAEFLPHSVL